MTQIYGITVTLLVDTRPRYFKPHCFNCGGPLSGELNGIVVGLSDGSFQEAPVVLSCLRKYCQWRYPIVTLSDKPRTR